MKNPLWTGFNFRIKEENGRFWPQMRIVWWLPIWFYIILVGDRFDLSFNKANTEGFECLRFAKDSIKVIKKWIGPKKIKYHNVE